MKFKVAGMLLLLVGIYLAFDSFLLALNQPSASVSAQVYPMLAIFIVLLVRVLQAEKHHRDFMRTLKRDPDAEEVEEVKAHAAISNYVA